MRKYIEFRILSDNQYHACVHIMETVNNIYSFTMRHNSKLTDGMVTSRVMDDSTDPCSVASSFVTSLEPVARRCDFVKPTGVSHVHMGSNYQSDSHDEGTTTEESPCNSPQRPIVMREGHKRNFKTMEDDRNDPHAHFQNGQSLAEYSDKSSPRYEYLAMASDAKPSTKDYLLPPPSRKPGRMQLMAITTTIRATEKL